VGTLISAAGAIQEVIEEEDPLLVDTLFRHISTFISKKRPEIAQLLLLQFYSFLRLIYGDPHPITLICRRLLAVGGIETTEIASNAQENVTVQFEPCYIQRMFLLALFVSSD